MSPPNFCEPCGRYHSRDYQDCVRRQSIVRGPDNTSAPDTDRPNVDAEQLARVAEASDHRYVAGWVTGYQAAMSDRAERQP